MRIKKKNAKTLIVYSQTIDDAYEKLEDCIQTKKRKVLILFDMIIDMNANKKLSPIVTELFLRRTRLNISLVFTL